MAFRLIKLRVNAEQNSRLPRVLYFIRLVGFLLFNLILLSIQYYSPHLMRSIKQSLNDIVLSSLSWVSQPLQEIENLIIKLKVFRENFKYLAEINKDLQDLHFWRSKACQLTYENQKLQQLLNYVKYELEVVVTTNAFFNRAGIYRSSLIIRAGANQGIKKNQLVMAQKRLVGRVVEVFNNFARVLLITDYYSKIPIIAVKSQLNGILRGTYTTKLVFVHKREQTQLIDGDLVFTTGEEGIFPPDYLIGTLEIDNMGRVLVETGINWHEVNIVQVLSTIPSSLPNNHGYLSQYGLIN